MAGWSRDNLWRQGGLLGVDAFERLGIEAPSGHCFGAIAISHDCDLANDNIEVEPCVEFIFAIKVGGLNGNYRFAKNPRKLHVEIDHEGGNALELLATNKFSLKKELLAELEIDPNASLSVEDVRVLQSWLAARYRRQAMPDDFVDRLKFVFEFLSRRGKTQANGILGYWFSYAPLEFVSGEEPYELWIYIVYTTDDHTAGGHAESIARDLVSSFDKLLAKTGSSGSVVLVECAAYSEEEFTLRDLRDNIEYKMDYLSHAQSPAGPLLD